MIGLVTGLALAAVAGPGASAQEPPSTTVPPAPTTTVISEGTPAPAPEGNRNISGTIQGIDGNAVNAQISLVLRDAQDRPIHMDGTVHGNRAFYERTISMNPTAPIDGMAAGGDKNWQITGLPPNAE